ncbi:MAG: hypothetical protein SPC28_03975 [Alloprevotella sp.]|nr:hypothetical protein [Alloprevotella sp.]
MLRENSRRFQGNFHDKAHRKNYKGANFYGLAYNFNAHIRQFFRSYMIVGPKNAKRGKACALPLSAWAKISRKSRAAKMRCAVPPAVKASRRSLAEAVGCVEQDVARVKGGML